jgi:hypothetical protein
LVVGCLAEGVGGAGGWAGATGAGRGRRAGVVLALRHAPRASGGDPENETVVSYRCGGGYVVVRGYVRVGEGAAEDERAPKEGLSRAVSLVLARRHCRADIAARRPPPTHKTGAATLAPVRACTHNSHSTPSSLSITKPRTPARLRKGALSLANQRTFGGRRSEADTPRPRRARAHASLTSRETTTGWSSTTTHWPTCRARTTT